MFRRCVGAFFFPGFSPDSEAMGVLLQITTSCPCALSRQVAGAGCWCWVLGAGAAVSWLCT